MKEKEGKERKKRGGREGKKRKEGWEEGRKGGRQGRKEKRK